MKIHIESRADYKLYITRSLRECDIKLNEAQVRAMSVMLIECFDEGISFAKGQLKVEL